MIFQSRIVENDGYYEVSFTKHGIELTQITKEELNEIPFSNWAFMSKGQFIVGSNVHDWKKRPLLPGYDDGSDLPLNIQPSISPHQCSFNESYQGLFETYKFCSCGKKE